MRCGGNAQTNTELHTRTSSRRPQTRTNHTLTIHTCLHVHTLRTCTRQRTQTHAHACTHTHACTLKSTANICVRYTNSHTAAHADHRFTRTNQPQTRTRLHNTGLHTHVDTPCLHTRTQTHKRISNICVTHTTRTHHCATRPLDPCGSNLLDGHLTSFCFLQATDLTISLHIAQAEQVAQSCTIHITQH